MAQHGNTKQILLCKLTCLLSCLCMIASISEGRDTLQVGEILRDWDVLESSGKKFQLLFFGSSFSSDNYIGIRTTGPYDGSGNIWVANRDSPLADHSGFLNLTSNGTLMINSAAGTPFIVNPGQKSLTGNLSLTLLDSGNLVLREERTIIWQSLDFPVDTWLAGMKIGLFGLKSGQPRQQVLVSWLSPFVPSSGALTLGVDPNNTKQLMIWRRGAVYWRSGTWDGQYFPRLSFNTFKRVSNENESYFTLTVGQGQVNAWITLNSSGAMDANTELSDNGWELTEFSCENNNGGWGDGCVNASQSNCSLGDEFVQTTSFSGFFDYMNYSVSIGIDDCRYMCIKNCSCIAYASADLDGTGCMFSGNISSEGSGLTSKNAYIRQKDVTEEGKKRSLIFIAVPVASLILIVILISLCYWRRRIFCLGEKDDARYNRQDRDEELSIYELNADFEGLNNKKDSELPFFSFSVIKSATDDFSVENKLGQGGFGPVYKGKLENGQEIAVKRLAQYSGQGTKEFENEVILISKLQHRNLVRLIGCCIKGEEKLLIYEYMPNGSLDSFIFDATKRVLLDWSKRFSIMEGIAQGLLYLHKHSRLRIIHRDLKTSNILLDSDLTPKISDFGTARIFGDNESRANTSRIVGTYGYMSPEYAMDGLFSVKSDVFSYGVMMLEIITGRKNTGFYHADRFMNLLGYAWDLWKVGKSLELMDPELEETSSMTNEVIRCVQIALLCVQENAGDRPNMSDVLSMLTHETVALPTPKQPAFFLNESANQELSTEEAALYSVSKATVSDVSGR